MTDPAPPPAELASVDLDRSIDTLSRLYADPATRHEVEAELGNLINARRRLDDILTDWKLRSCSQTHNVPPVMAVSPLVGLAA